MESIQHILRRMAFRIVYKIKDEGKFNDAVEMLGEEFKHEDAPHVEEDKKKKEITLTDADSRQERRVDESLKEHWISTEKTKK